MVRLNTKQHIRIPRPDSGAAESVKFLLPRCESLVEVMGKQYRRPCFPDHLLQGPKQSRNVPRAVLVSVSEGFVNSVRDNEPEPLTC